MTSPIPITLQSQPYPGPGGKPMALGGSGEPAKKPKKVNSEIRKQQNRIASKNYREKRKKKLQYLQQLIKDESDQQESEPSPESHDVYARSISTDYESLAPDSSPYILPSRNSFESMSSSSAAVAASLLPASTATFEDYHHASALPYSAFDSTWSDLPHSLPPPTGMTWNVPQWTTSLDFSPRVSQRPDTYHYTSSMVHTAFEPAQMSLQQPREIASNVDFSALGSSVYGSQAQTHGIPNHMDALHSPNISFNRSVRI